MERKSSNERGASYYVYLPIVQAECPDSEFNISYNQIEANMPP